MSELSQRELQHIQQVGGVALECTSQRELRDELLRHIQDTLVAHSGVFFHCRTQEGETRFFDGFSRGVPEDAPEIWRTQYHEVDPFVCAFLQHLRSGGERVMVSSNVVRNRDYVRTAFYCDFLKPQSVHHVLVAGLVTESEPVALLGLHRPTHAPPFSSNDVLKMNLILPHLSAAVDKVNMMDKLTARQCIVDTLAQDLARAAVLMLDQDYEVLVANEPAASMLRLPESRHPARVALPEQIRSCCDELKAMIARDGQTRPEYRASVNFHIDGTPMSGTIRAHESGPRALRFIVYFGNAGQQLVRPDRLTAYGLTERESEIVHLVGCGQTNAQIASSLKISTRTVENHLRSIYGKVNVHNRTSLLSRLAREH